MKVKVKIKWENRTLKLYNINLPRYRLPIRDDSLALPSSLERTLKSRKISTETLLNVNTLAHLQTENFKRIVLKFPIGKEILAVDWKKTSLGSIDTWSRELRTCVVMMLNSPFREAIWAGKSYTLLYNDEYKKNALDKHPWMLGKEGAVAWAEIWDDLKWVFLVTLFS